MRYRKSSILASSMALIILTTLLLTASSSATAQQPPGGKPAESKDELPDSLEGMLTAALDNNPDIRAAKAQVEQAQVELNRIRLEIAQRVVAARNALDAQHNEIDIAKLRLEQTYSQLQHLREAWKVKSGVVSENEVRQGEFTAQESERSILREEAKLSNLEAELRYLLGRFPKGMPRQAYFGDQAARLTVSPYLELLNKDNRFDVPAQMKTLIRPEMELANPMLERIQKPLAEPLDLEFIETPLSDVLEYLGEITDVRFVIQPIGLAEANIDPQEEMITVNVGDVESVASALRVIRDLVPSLRFVVRDYGILVTSEFGVEPGAIVVNAELPVVRGR